MHEEPLTLHRSSPSHYPPPMIQRLPSISTMEHWSPKNAPPRFAGVISGLRYDSCQLGRWLSLTPLLCPLERVPRERIEQWEGGL
jgi:hypothetical protein